MKTGRNCFYSKCKKISSYFQKVIKNVWKSDVQMNFATALVFSRLWWSHNLTTILNFCVPNSHLVGLVGTLVSRKGVLEQERVNTKSDGACLSQWWSLLGNMLSQPYGTYFQSPYTCNQVQLNFWIWKYRTSVFRNKSCKNFASKGEQQIAVHLRTRRRWFSCARALLGRSHTA